MNAHRVETTLSENGTLTLHDLPFQAGAAVEVIVLETNGASIGKEKSTKEKSTKEKSTPVQDGEKQGVENWAEALARECDELCRQHGYGDAPANFAATWKEEKQRLILEQNSQQ